MTRDQLKARILTSIDRRASDIIAIGERIRKNPELGFKEVKTARLLELQRTMARREVYEGR